MKRHILLLLFAGLLLLILGCTLPPQKPLQVTPVPAGSATGTSLPEEKLGQEIGFLTAILEEGKLTPEDKVVAENLLKTCRNINRTVSGPVGEAEYRKIIVQLIGNLNTLERHVFLNVRKATGTGQAPIELFFKRKKDILNSYLAGDYQRVISQCLELKKDFGRYAVTPQIGMLFSLALARKGMLEEAIDIGSSVVRKLEQEPGLILLETKIAEWQSRLGQDNAAIFNYEKVTDLMDERKALVEKLSKDLGQPLPVSTGVQNLKANPSQENQGKTGTTGTPGPGSLQPTKPVVQGSPNQAQSETGNGIPNSMADLLILVKKMIHAHQFEDARAVLVRKKQENISAADKQAIDQALKTLDQAENTFLQERIASLGREDILKKIQKLIDEQKYKEAISRLQDLETAGTPSQEIMSMKQEAEQGFINQERNRAAEFFLKAKATNDPGEKEQYLDTSRDILNNLLNEFPLSPLYNKIKDNLEKVNEQLDKLPQ